MPLAAKGPGLPCVVVPKSSSQEFHSILKLYDSWNVENMAVFMFHYLLTCLHTGPEPVLSVQVDEYVFIVQKEPFIGKDGDILESSDDSSVSIFMLILYDTVRSFHLARLGVLFLSLSLFSLNHTRAFKRSPVTQTLESLNYHLLCTGALQYKREVNHVQGEENMFTMSKCWSTSRPADRPT